MSDSGGVGSASNPEATLAHPSARTLSPPPTGRWPLTVVLCRLKSPVDHTYLATKRAISNGHTRHTAALLTDSFREEEPALLPRHTWACRDGPQILTQEERGAAGPQNESGSARLGGFLARFTASLEFGAAIVHRAWTLVTYLHVTRDKCNDRHKACRPHSTVRTWYCKYLYSTVQYIL